MGARYFTLVPHYYDITGIGVNIVDVDRTQFYLKEAPAAQSETERLVLRNPQAFPPDRRHETTSQYGRLHQLHFMSGRKTMEPEF